MEILKKYIDDGIECATVDFKLQFYSADKKHDFIKDILSFANNCSSVDKYIIIGYNNTDNLYKDVSDDTIDDISNFNQLINEYCDPFIDIHIGKFEHCGHKLAFIQIKKINTNGPYLVKKDYKKETKTFLRKGEIYIRKNANNFIADRYAIDFIYETRKKMLLEIDTYEMGIVSIKQGIGASSKYCFMLKLINRTSSTFSFNKGKIKFKYDNNCFETEIEYIEDYFRNYKKELSSIKTNPFVMEKKTQALKAIVFNLSDQVVDFIKNKFAFNEKARITITLVDLQKKEHRTDFPLNKVYWD